MSTAVFHRRRVERLARLLDETSGPGRHYARIDDDAELTGMATICRRISTIPVVTAPGGEFRDSLRARLVATAERDGIGRTHRMEGVRVRPARATAAKSGWRSSRARGAILVGVAAGAVALSGISTASNGAVPGDALYGVKRSTEKAQLALAGSDVGRGQLYLEFARTRLAEAKAVRTDPTELKSVLTDMDTETRLGVRLLTTTAVEHRDTAALDVIDRFADTQRTDLVETSRTLAPASTGEAMTSLALLDEVSTRVDDLRESLGCPGAGGTTADALGPVPAPCPQPSTSVQPRSATVTPTPTSSDKPVAQAGPKGNPPASATDPGSPPTTTPANPNPASKVPPGHRRGRDRAEIG